MSIHRFYLPPERCQGRTLTLSDAEAHHAIDVLRVRPEDRVIVLDGAGQEVSGEILSLSHGHVLVQVIQRHSQPRLPYQLTLIQALPKGKLMESIIQKATELGAARVVPILAERTVTHLEEESAAHKQERWRHTAVEAIKQCGAAWLPQIDAPASPQTFLGRGERFDLTLLASLQDGARHPRAHLQDALAERGQAPKSVAVWVGPEGDFTPAEINAIRASGAVPVTLGPVVLRCETAAIYCLSVLSYELQAPLAPQQR
jgi:16S rRNA (uracil1498-N3)-methyltransferase